MRLRFTIGDLMFSVSLFAASLGLARMSIAADRPSWMVLAILGAGVALGTPFHRPFAGILAVLALLLLIALLLPAGLIPIRPTQW